MALNLRALYQRLLGNTVVEDVANEAEVERRLRLAFGSPGISSTGVFNFAFPPVGAMGGFFDVHTYGAVGDGTTDDTAAITAAAAAAGSGTVFFRAGKTYRITSTVSILTDDQVWWLYGATIRVGFVGAGITIASATTYVQRAKVLGGLIDSSTGTLDWTAGGCGIRLLKCNNCTVRDVFVRFLEKGIEITTPAPPNNSETTQNWIVNPVIASCALPLYFFANDLGTINENTVTGGQISYSSSDPSATGRYAITIDRHVTATGNVNGLKFIGVYLGNSKTTNKPNAVFLDGVGTHFLACHIEGFPTPMVTFDGDAVLGTRLPNMFWGGAADYFTPEIDLDSDGVGIAAPFLFTGLDGAGIAGGGNAASAYVWLVKVLGAGSKIGLAIKDAADAITFKVNGFGQVTSGKDTVEGGYFLNGPAGSSRSMFYRTASLPRWETRTNATAEGGANAGSNFQLTAYDDAGASLGNALLITRSTRSATFLSSLFSSSPTGGIGYTTGAGGAQTQASSKATTVVSNTITTAITMNNAALNTGVIVSFTFTNSAIAATDTLLVTHESAGTVGCYSCWGQPGAGTSTITVKNISAGNLSEAIVLRVTVIKSVNS